MRPTLILLLTLWGCEPAERAAASVEPPPATAPSSSSDQPADEISIAPDLGLEMAPQPAVIETRSAPIDVEEAEDGWGQWIPAPAPIAIEIHAERWGGRAQDPVLHVGERRFRRYSHPGPGLIRFVIADEGWLESGTPLAVQYGDDILTRVELSLIRGSD